MLKSIRFINYRCFDDHELPVNPETIIVGKNNAGKSTIIEGLRLLAIITNVYLGTLLLTLQKVLTLPYWVDKKNRTTVNGVKWGHTKWGQSKIAYFITASDWLGCSYQATKHPQPHACYCQYVDTWLQSFHDRNPEN